MLFLKLCETFSYVGYFEYNFRGPPFAPKKVSASNCFWISSDVNAHSKFSFDVCFILSYSHVINLDWPCLAGLINSIFIIGSQNYRADKENLTKAQESSSESSPPLAKPTTLMDLAGMGKSWPKFKNTDQCHSLNEYLKRYSADKKVLLNMLMVILKTLKFFRNFSFMIFFC